MCLCGLLEGFVGFRAADLAESTDRRIAESRLSVCEGFGERAHHGHVPRRAERHRAFRRNLGLAIRIVEHCEQNCPHGRVLMKPHRSNRGRHLVWAGGLE
jgi:hypothetical protein